MFYLLIPFFTYLTIFIYGLLWMRICFHTVFLKRFEQFEPKMNVFYGFLMGLAITIAIQSSSASIALLMSFIQPTKRTPYYFILTYIIGANLGTTVSSQIFIYNHDLVIISCIILGACLAIFFHRNRIGFSLSGVFIGSALIFIAIKGFENISLLLTDSDSNQVIQFANDSNWKATLAGLSFTSFIQSSSSLVGILIGTSSNHIFSIEAVYYLLLGANIGTCSTILIVAMGQSNLLKFIGYSHLWINIFTALLFSPKIISHYIITFTQLISENEMQQIVILSICINLLSGIVLLIFLKPLHRFIIKLHKIRE
ncbi:Na/Pi symporter [Halalkalibacillus halophilus]|uniref:Na/Pi symporter n=1 Tax=Halalkalibacillus halophilus TaxID=392827 RepID=UPI0004262D4C|nr:Na/Pi symporter [Halalkalibacillus halophilus]